VCTAKATGKKCDAENRLHAITHPKRTYLY